MWRAAPPSSAGPVRVAVGIDGQLAGHLITDDPLRDGARDMLSGLRGQGVERILLATGDRREVAERVTPVLGPDGIRAGLIPDQKVLLVLNEHTRGPVMMVGDDANDAPALAAVAVDVAMDARGAASAEAAEVVLLVDRIDRLGTGMEIALESVVAGMVAAALGSLTPVQGALLQVAIDGAVILNALRALRIAPAGRPPSASAPIIPQTSLPGVHPK